ncbi:hypothetical protein ABPG72_016021 [Tetrahymena utriculariae]
MNRGGVEFLSPNTISCLIVLKEYSRNASELDPSNPFANFLINKIMKLNEEDEALSSSQFFKKMIKETQNFDISDRYRVQIERIQSLHDLYSYLENTLKELRQMRIIRIEQGNIIDIFLRRSLLNLRRCGFSEMVKLWQNFLDYKNDEYKLKKNGQNVYLIDKKLEDLQLKILNFDNCYGYDEIQKQIDSLENGKINDKISYLKAQNEAKNQHPLAALDNIHRYFDKQLEMLFFSDKQGEQQVSYNQSKVNHCILNLAYLNLQMGFVDECLKSLSEAMRISQNNQDDESINHCIMYLYEISSLLSHHQDTIQLTQHAICHSVNIQSNPLLMLYSCLSYAKFSKHYDLNNKNTDLLKQNNIKWIDLFHFSIRKIIQNYENYLLPDRKQSKYVLLQIPRSLEFMIKSQIFDSQNQPALVDLLINNVYETTPQVLVANKNLQILFEIAIKQVDWDLDKSVTLFQKLYEMMNNMLKPLYQFYLYYSNAKMFLNRMEIASSRFMLELMIDIYQNNLIDPLLNAQIQQIHIEILIKENKHSEAYQAILQNIKYNQQSGFHKELLTQSYIYLIMLKYQTRDFFSALTLIQQVLKKAKLYGLHEQYSVAKLYKVLILIHTGYISSTLKIIKNIEEKWLMNFSQKTQAFFYYVKSILLLKISTASDYINKQVFDEIRKNALQCLNKSLEFYLNLNCLLEIREIYYLQARIYDELPQSSHRESTAFYFIQCDEMISQNQTNSYISTYHIQDLSLYQIQLALSQVFKKTFKIVNLPSIIGTYSTNTNSQSQ